MKGSRRAPRCRRSPGTHARASWEATLATAEEPRLGVGVVPSPAQPPAKVEVLPSDEIAVDAFVLDGRPDLLPQRRVIRSSESRKKIHGWVTGSNERILLTLRFELFSPETRMISGCRAWYSRTIAAVRSVLPASRDHHLGGEAHHTLDAGGDIRLNLLLTSLGVTL